MALSSCEAEYIALEAAVQEGMYLTQMMKDIAEVSGPVLIFEDNQGTYIHTYIHTLLNLPKGAFQEQ